MKENLMICLGNPMMGDDGVGWHLFRRLTANGSAPEHWEIIFAGSDLLAAASAMEGRRLVVLLDAMESPPPYGRVEFVECERLPVGGLRKNAHQFSAAESLSLLQLTTEGLKGVRFVLAGVAVESVRFGSDLSAELSARIPQIVDELNRHLLDDLVKEK